MEDGKIVSRTPLQIRFVGGRRTERLYLLAELLGDKDQIEDVDDTIAIGVWGGFAESVGDLYQIQDVDAPITVDIGKTFGFEIDFAIEVGERVGNRRRVVSPIRDGGGRCGERDDLGYPTAIIDRPAVGELADK